MRSPHNPGSALVTVLWCMAILGVVAFSVLHTARMNLRISRNDGDAIQAHYLALAGVEKAKALIYQQSQELEELGTAYSENLRDDPSSFEDVKLGRGLYRVIRPPEAGEAASRRVFGIVGESNHLNVNTCSLEELKKLPNMDPEIAAAVMDWRDEDSDVSPGGAEAPTYQELRDPYLIRNAPFRSPLELLQVQGVDPQALLGEDFNANGILDPEEDDSEAEFPVDNGDGALDGGWLQNLTLESGVRNVTARGDTPVDVAGASEDELTEVDGITTEIAQAIVAFRGNGNLASIAQLLDVTRPAQNGENANNSNPNNSNNSNNSNNANRGNRGNNANNQGTGEKMISQDLLKQIADAVSVGTETILPGRVNVNAADQTVLATLPGVSEELADAIIEKRGEGYFQSVADLLDVQGMNENVFKQLAPRVTVREDTYRIVAEGEIPSTGARRRVITVVRFDGDEFQTLYYREDL